MAAAAGLPAHGVLPFAAFVNPLPGWLVLEAERRRFFLWLPVCFGVGITAYFAAAREPSIWAPAIAFVLCAGAAFLCRRDWRAQAAFIALAAMFAGFGAGVLRTALVRAPILQHRMIGQLSGFIETVERRERGARIVILPDRLGRLAPDELPRRVRVTLRQNAEVAPGDYVTTTARLLPPPEPASPGGYNFARDAFFQRLGAVGSISGGLNISAPPHPLGLSLRMATALDQARNTLTARIVHAYGGQAGALAAALVTGKRGYISEETNDDLRAAGIYHIVSISGLHMVLAAGVFFWAARALLSLVPFMALTWPVKKIAALVGMAGATAYCLFSGSEVATERSLVMTLVIFGAILADRPALSMRNLALSALIVLAREPESLLGPSFQMSFAAVAGLIAFAETPRLRESDGEVPESRIAFWIRAARRAVIADLLTTCIATLATAPFSAYHFQTLNPLGVLGNALALPFISLIAMPAAVIGVVAGAFGLDGPVWWLMGLASQPVLMAAHFVAGLQGARFQMAAFGTGPLALFVLAILFATLWTTALRWSAIVPAMLGLVLAVHPARPDLIVDRMAQGAALRGPDGRFVFLGRPSDFVAAQWLKTDGDARQTGDPSLKQGTACDPLGCVGHLTDRRAVSLVKSPDAFEEDCRRAAIIVSRLTAPADCAASLVIDRDWLEAHGATAANLTSQGLRIASARDPDQTRPWLRPISANTLATLRERADNADAKARLAKSHVSAAPMMVPDDPGASDAAETPDDAGNQ